MAHGRVVPRREEEPDPALLDASGHRFRRKLDLDAQRGQHVGAAALRRDRAVAVLGDARATRRGDERGGSRDVERVRCVAARAAGIDQAILRDFHPRGARAQRLCGAGDLVRRLPFHAQRNQERRHLRRRGAAIEHRVQRRRRLHTGEVDALDRQADLLAQGHRLHPQEVAEQRLAVGREDRFGVELDADHGQLQVAKRHDDAVLRAGGNLEVLGERPPVHHQ